MKAFIVLHTFIWFLYCSAVTLGVSAIAGIFWWKELPSFWFCSFFYLVFISFPIYCVGEFLARQFNKRFKRL